MSDLENDSDSSSKEDARAYQLAHLAAVMMAPRIQNKNLGIADDTLCSPAWDQEFEGALKRADMLLKKAQNRDFQVSIYQVFREGETLSLEQIATILKDIKWPQLTAKASVKKLLETLETEMNSLIGLIEKHPVREAQPAFDQIKNGLKEIEQLSEVKAHYPTFDDDAKWFLETLDRHPEAKKVPPTLRQDFLDWCFIHENKGSTKIKKYRPHEIFRFCAPFNSMPEVPEVSLSDLSSEFHPYPPQSLWPLKFPVFDARPRTD